MVCTRYYFRERLNGTGVGGTNVEVGWEPPWRNAVTHVTHWVFESNPGDGDYTVGVRGHGYTDWYQKGPDAQIGIDNGAPYLPCLQDGEQFIGLAKNSADGDALTLRLEGWWESLGADAGT